MIVSFEGRVMMTYMKKNARRAAMGAVALVMVAESGDAQSIESRVAGARNGLAELRFAARDGICGDGRNFIRIGPNTFYGTMRDGWSRREERCRPGPVRVVMRVTNGNIGDMR